VRYSHKWSNDTNNTISESDFHSSHEDSPTGDSHREQFVQGLTSDLIESDTVEFVCVEIPKGGVAFHHQNTWHGSGINNSDSTARRALVLHALNAECEFRTDIDISYTYGRYQLKHDRKKVDESFYPICSTNNRSEWLTGHCANDPVLV